MSEYQRIEIERLRRRLDAATKAVDPLTRLRGFHIYWIGGEEKWDNERDLREFSMTVTKAELDLARVWLEEATDE